MNDAEDFNHDGIHDLVAVVPACELGWGKMAMYLGYHWLNPNPIWYMEGRSAPLDLIGILWPIGLGDVNGDGLDDLAIGATNSNTDGRRGRVVILSGDPDLQVGVDDQTPLLPDQLMVDIYPNPFNASTTFYIEIPNFVSEIRLTVFNLLGQTVADETLYSTGPTLHYSFDAHTLTSGVYLLKVSNGIHQNIQKLVVLK